MNISLKILSLMILAVVLASCTAAASPVPVTGPTQPVGTIPSMPAATATDQPKDLPGTTATPGDEKTVTLEDNNKTIMLQAGDHFLLKLGETYAWEIETPDPTVVSRVMYIMAVKGSQGLFTAHQAGKTVLTARGEPLCRSEKPACMIPSATFKIDIVVK
jgi:hypothetical protein